MVIIYAIVEIQIMWQSRPEEETLIIKGRVRRRQEHIQLHFIFLRFGTLSSTKKVLTKIVEQKNPKFLACTLSGRVL